MKIVKIRPTRHDTELPVGSHKRGPLTDKILASIITSALYSNGYSEFIVEVTNDND